MEVGNDILKLRSAQLQKLAIIRIAQLNSGEAEGTRLKHIPGTWPAELGDCWKLYFGEQEHDVGQRLNRQPPLYRIVYRFLGPVPDPTDRDRRPRLQVLAVGLRYQSEVYERAVSRLARPEVAGERSIQPVRRDRQRIRQAVDGRRNKAQEEQRQQARNTAAEPRHLR